MAQRETVVAIRTIIENTERALDEITNGEFALLSDNTQNMMYELTRTLTRLESQLELEPQDDTHWTDDI